jgi:hypothetical protein
MRPAMPNKKETQSQKRRLQYMKIVDAKKNVNTIFNELLEILAMDLPQRSQRNLTIKEMKERLRDL